MCAKRSSRILVAPLNWGLGHATRCIPVIRELQRRGCDVILASDGAALALLRHEFPGLKALEIPGYGITYRRTNMVINLGLQFPRILQTIFRERRWLKEVVGQYGIDAIISDNRFGLYHDRIPTVFISHQIRIPIPGLLLNRIGNTLNQAYIRRFGELWIPDFAGKENLSGAMSHGTPLDGRASYLGAISRMEVSDHPIRYDIIVILSGPEPQRTHLEQILLHQLAGQSYKTLFVRGLPDSPQRAVCSDQLEMVSFLTGKELSKAIQQSRLVVSRSGYTTLLDLAVLGRKALLIPTPGQREQEVLAVQFAASGLFHSTTQQTIQLEKDIPEALSRPGFQSPALRTNRMPEVVGAWLEKHRLVSPVATRQDIDRTV